ncbi:MAG: hypothetical protein AB1750_21210, partial [Chloroflexota bacterium]
PDAGFRQARLFHGSFGGEPRRTSDPNRPKRMGREKHQVYFLALDLVNLARAFDHGINPALAGFPSAALRAANAFLMRGRSSAISKASMIESHVCMSIKTAAGFPLALGTTVIFPGAIVNITASDFIVGLVEKFQEIISL